MDKKITKTEYFDRLKAIVTDSEVPVDEKVEILEFLDTQIVQLAAKAEKAKARAAEKKAVGDELREAVQATLTDEFQTIEDILDKIEGEDLSPAKISARLTALIKTGIAEKELQPSESGRKRMGYRLKSIED